MLDHILRAIALYVVIGLVQFLWRVYPQWRFLVYMTREKTVPEPTLGLGFIFVCFGEFILAVLWPGVLVMGAAWVRKALVGEDEQERPGSLLGLGVRLVG